MHGRAAKLEKAERHKPQIKNILGLHWNLGAEVSVPMVVGILVVLGKGGKLEIKARKSYITSLLMEKMGTTGEYTYIR